MTPPAEKTKTQGQNSSKKLKEKTQPLGGIPLKIEKLKKITQFLDKKFLGYPYKCHFCKQISSDKKFFGHVCQNSIGFFQ